MAKVFNVEQLRLNNKLLTGNAGGELFYDGVKLAAGSTAVPLGREITFGNGIRFSTGSATEDLSQDRTINLMVDNDTIGFNSATPNPQLFVKDGSIDFNKLSSDVNGPGINGGGGAQLSVSAGSGIRVSNDDVNIDEAGVISSMIADDAVGNDQLATITEDNKIQGNAVTLDNSSLTTGSSAGLRISAQGVNKAELHADVAGAGLAGGNGFALDVGAGSGITVDATNVNISVGGVSNDMLEGSIADSKLSPISTTDKVLGDAIKLEGSTLDVTANGLHVADAGITATQIAAGALGDGLGGGGGASLFVNGGSGITSNAAGTHISETGIVNTMIANGTISEGKLAGGIGNDKLALTYGSGVTADGDVVNVDLASSDPGLEFSANKIQVDDTVVRTLSSATQTLAGNYTFSNDVILSSGLTINGNLEIRGDTTITQSNEVQIGDNVIVLNSEYAGDTPPDAGIEVERGTQTNASFLFDDDGDNQWVAGINGSLHRVETKEFSRSYSLELDNNIGGTGVLFGHTFESAPSVVVSVQHTGKYGVSSPDFLGAMVTGISTSGVDVSFTSNTPHSGYFLNIHATVA